MAQVQSVRCETKRFMTGSGHNRAIAILGIMDKLVEKDKDADFWVDADNNLVTFTWHESHVL